MKNIIMASVLLVALTGCDEIANATDEACELIVTGCVLTVVQDYEFCQYSVGDPYASAEELAKRCDAFYRGAMCQCFTNACVRDVTRHGYDYDKWTRDAVAGMNCPAAILDPYASESEAEP